jgi:hypothetical protein
MIFNLLRSSQTTRVFSIANVTFDNVDDEEKKTYTGQSGSVYEGYKPRQTWVRNFLSFLLYRY